MEDHRFLRKEGEDEKEALINADSPSESGKALLDRMKYISGLISEVYLSAF